MFSIGRAPMRVGAVFSAVLCTATYLSAGPAAALGPKSADVALEVLVVDDGSPMTDAIKDRLLNEGQRFTTIDLRAKDRAAVTSDFLVKTDRNKVHAKFSGIVLPNDDPAQLSAAEKALLNSYSSAFKVRQVISYTWAHPEVGLNYPTNGGMAGPIDGMRASVTTEGAADAFSYLQGVTLDDISPDVVESHGYLSTPVDASFTPFVTAPIPNSDAKGSLVGVHSKDGRERLVITFAANKYQNHWKTLSHGVVRWLTRGISTTYNRNYLSVHIDDVLLPDTLWSEEGNCTIGDGCDPDLYPEDGPGATSRMVASDVNRLTDWQKAHDIKLDMVFNGNGAKEFKEEFGKDPLEAALLANKSQLRWVSHTWSHPFLGCVQEKQGMGPTDWTCEKDRRGRIKYVPFNTLVSEIAQNDVYAFQNRLPKYDSTVLVTGEHSGLKSLPQMAVDNPYLSSALWFTGKHWTASDASREREQRLVGNALTVPRYPMNIFYNTETKAQAVDEYNWVYNSAADGGSGICEKLTDTMTCIKPLDKTTGFDSYIVPIESRIALGHVLSNDARPHYVHQPNLAADGIIYPVVDSIISTYRSDFSGSAPLVNVSMKESGVELERKAAWAGKQSAITGTVSGKSVTLKNTSRNSIQAPVTLPTGAKQGRKSFGSEYGSELSAWENIGRGATSTYSLASDSGFATSVEWPPAAPAPAPAGARVAAPELGGTTIVRVNEANSAALEKARALK